MDPTGRPNEPPRHGPGAHRARAPSGTRPGRPATAGGCRAADRRPHRAAVGATASPAGHEPRARRGGAGRRRRRGACTLRRCPGRLGGGRTHVDDGASADRRAPRGDRRGRPAGRGGTGPGGDVCGGGRCAAGCVRDAARGGTVGARARVRRVAGRSSVGGCRAVCARASAVGRRAVGHGVHVARGAVADRRSVGRVGRVGGGSSVRPRGERCASSARPQAVGRGPSWRCTVGRRWHAGGRGPSTARASRSVLGRSGVFVGSRGGRREADASVPRARGSSVARVVVGSSVVARGSSGSHASVACRGWRGERATVAFRRRTVDPGPVRRCTEGLARAVDPGANDRTACTGGAGGHRRARARPAGDLERRLRASSGRRAVVARPAPSARSSTIGRRRCFADGRARACVAAVARRCRPDGVRWTGCPPVERRAVVRRRRASSASSVRRRPVVRRPSVTCRRCARGSLGCRAFVGDARIPRGHRGAGAWSIVGRSSVVRRRPGVVRRRSCIVCARCARCVRPGARAGQALVDGASVRRASRTGSSRCAPSVVRRRSSIACCRCARGVRRGPRAGQGFVDGAPVRRASPGSSRSGAPSIGRRPSGACA